MKNSLLLVGGMENLITLNKDGKVKQAKDSG